MCVCEECLLDWVRSIDDMHLLIQDHSQEKMLCSVWVFFLAMRLALCHRSAALCIRGDSGCVDHRRGRGRGKGRGRRKRPVSADSDGEREKHKCLCHERMAALLHASSKGAFNLECCGDVAFNFAFRVATAGDDLPLIHTQWSQSAMVSSQYYSRRVWALGAVVQGAGGTAATGEGKSFELASPLQFLSGVELMQQIHAQAEAHATKAFKVVAAYLFSKIFLFCLSGSRL